MREQENKQEWIYGLRPLIEAVNSGKEVEKVLIQKGLGGNTFHELMPLLKENKIPYQIVPLEKLNRVTRKNHQGIVAYLSPVSFFQIEQILPSLYEEEKSLSSWFLTG